MTKKYIQLSEIEHVLKRPGRYLGSTKDHTEVVWIPKTISGFEEKKCTYNPALIKMFDEVISNSVDESKRSESNLDTIKVTIKDDGSLSVWDNGGISVTKHETGIYMPELIFGNLRTGSNFDDTEQSTATGQNGEGSSLVNIFSTKFKVDTGDGKNKYSQTFSNNLSQKTSPDISPSDKSFTKITFTPDYDRLGTSLTNDNRLLIEKRVIDIAGCNPSLRVYLNGKQIKIKSFRDYISLYGVEFIYGDNENWNIGVSSSEGFRHISFVNSTPSKTGGTHIDYISNQIVNKLREYFKKKRKVDVKPSDIKNHLMLFIDATIINPRYSSQTKEDLITEIRDYKTEFVVTDKFINKLVKTDIIQSVLDWVEAKAFASNQAALRKLNKNNNKSTKGIVKFSDATKKGNREDCILFLAEGDSAASAIRSTRDSSFMGVYPLRGKPLNVRGVDVKKLIANKEFNEFMAIMGLRLGEDPKKMNFGKIIIAADSDKDGSHICGLVLNMINEYWSSLLSDGKVYKFITPVVKVTQNRKVISFYSSEEFSIWKKQNTKPFNSKFYKGLGTNSSKEFKEYLDKLDDHLVQLKLEDDEDKDSLDLAFDSKMADKRKEWFIS